MNDHDIQGPPVVPGRPRLLDLARETIRRRHYSYRTEQAYLHWMKSLPRSRNLGLAGDRRATTFGYPDPCPPEGAVLLGKLRDGL